MGKKANDDAIDELNKKKIKEEGELNTYTNNLASEIKTKESIENDNRELMVDISNHNSEYLDNAEKIRQLQNKNSELKAKIKKSRCQIEKNNKKIDVETVTIKDLAGKVHHTDKNLKATIKELNTRNGNIEKHNQRIKLESNEYTKYKMAVTKLEKDIQRRKDRNNALKAQMEAKDVEKYKKKLKELNVDKGNKEKRVSDLETIDIPKATKEYLSSKKLVDDLETKIHTLRNTISKVHEKEDKARGNKHNSYSQVVANYHILSNGKRYAPSYLISMKNDGCKTNPTDFENDICNYISNYATWASQFQYIPKAAIGADTVLGETTLNVSRERRRRMRRRRRLI